MWSNLTVWAPQAYRTATNPNSLPTAASIPPSPVTPTCFLSWRLLLHFHRSASWGLKSLRRSPIRPLSPPAGTLTLALCFLRDPLWSGHRNRPPPPPPLVLHRRGRGRRRGGCARSSDGSAKSSDGFGRSPGGTRSGMPSSTRSPP